MTRVPAVLLGISLAMTASIPSAALGDRNDCKWRALDVGATKPAARRHMAFVYDKQNHRVIMHGGDLETGGQEPGVGDVWVLDLNPGASSPRWTQIAPALDTNFGKPAHRRGHAAAYVPGDAGSPGRMIIHGGKDFGGVLLDDTWELSLGASPRWKRLSGDAFPTNRWHHTAVWFNGAFHIFGGNPAGALADLWRLEEPGNTWFHLGGPTTIACRPGEDRSGGPQWPNRRYYHSLIVDSDRNQMVVYGGDYESSCIASNMYETGSGMGPGCEMAPSIAGTWTKTIAEGQQGDRFSRIFHGAVYDPIGRRMITVGGYNPLVKGGCLEGALNTVSAVSLPVAGSSWYELDPAGTGPTGIAEHGTVYDSRGDRVILFGGVTGDFWNGPHSNEVWMLEFDLVAPKAVSDLSVQQVSANGANLRWTAPGDDQSSGTAFRYEVRYSASPITDDASFASGTLCDAPPIPVAPGQESSMFVPGTDPRVYVALKTWDESGNVSQLSNLVCYDTTLLLDCDNLVLLDVPAAWDQGAGAPELSLRGISPNPSSGVMRVGFSLARRGDAVLEVLDLAGRRVVARDLAGFEPGQHSIVLGGDAALAPGYYRVRLRQEGNAVTKPVIVR